MERKLACTRKEVANAILAITYTEMMEMADEMASSSRLSAEDNQPFDPCDRDQVADRLRWWAENYIEDSKDKK